MSVRHQTKGHRVGEGFEPSRNSERVRASSPVQTAVAFRRALAAHGVRGLFAQVPHYVSELAFDLRYGVRTAGQLLVTVNDENYDFDYDPIEPRRFHDAFRAFDIPANQTFVDFGCGKGRPLILAGNYGFPRVRGIEIVPEWCDDARRNLARWRRRTGSDCEAEVVLADARTYEIRPDESVFFFFNPFPADVLRVVVANIERSLDEHARDVWVVYANPVHRRSVFSDARWDAGVELPGPDHSFVLYRPRAGRGTPDPREVDTRQLSSSQPEPSGLRR